MKRAGILHDEWLTLCIALLLELSIEELRAGEVLARGHVERAPLVLTAQIYEEEIFDVAVDREAARIHAGCDREKAL